MNAATVMDSREMSTLLIKLGEKVDALTRRPKIELAYDEARALAAFLTQLADEIDAATGALGRNGGTAFVDDKAFMTVYVVAPGQEKGW